MDVAKQCPWCGRWALKDDACNWVTCGLATEGFVAGAGCGRQFCFLCQGKLCGRMYDADTGAAIPGVPSHHSMTCCAEELRREDPGTDVSTICPGGHNSHK